MPSPSQEEQFRGQIWALNWFLRELAPELLKLPERASPEAFERKVFELVQELDWKLGEHLIGQQDYAGRQVILGVISGFLERRFHNKPPFYFTDR